MIQPMTGQQTTVKNFRFNRGKKLGKGVTGSVYHGIDIMTGREVAVKVINMREIDNEAKSYLLKSEQNAMIGLKHPNIISCYDVIQQPAECYIVLQYCPEGTLDDYIKKAGQVPEQDALRIFRQLVSACKTMAQEGVVHRDLKPSNILMVNGCPKISDFGFCQIAGSLKPRMFYNVGSPSYMSPQAYMDNIYTDKSDLWSLGCILYEMVVGKTIDIGRRDITTLYDYIKSGKQFIPTGLSELSSSILARCFVLDPRRRIGITQLENIVNNALGPVTLNQSFVSNHPPSHIQGSPNKHMNLAPLEPMLSSNGLPYPGQMPHTPIQNMNMPQLGSLPFMSMNTPQMQHPIPHQMPHQMPQPTPQPIPQPIPHPTTISPPNPQLQIQLIQATPAQLPSLIRGQAINFQPPAITITPSEQNIINTVQVPIRKSTIILTGPQVNQNMPPEPVPTLSSSRFGNHVGQPLRSALMPFQEAPKIFKPPTPDKPPRSKTPFGFAADGLLRTPLPPTQNKIKKSIVDEGSWLAGHLSRQKMKINQGPMPLILPQIPLSASFGQPSIPEAILKTPLNPIGRTTRIVGTRNRSPETFSTPHPEMEPIYRPPLVDATRPLIFR